MFGETVIISHLFAAALGYFHLEEIDKHGAPHFNNCPFHAGQSQKLLVFEISSNCWVIVHWYLFCC